MKSCHRNSLWRCMKSLQWIAARVTVIAVLPFAAYSDIQFEDITAEAGISHKGPTYSAAWGDFNGDGAPDLYTTNHGLPRSLYLNDTQGTFNNIAGSVVPAPRNDAHGASWADFDNDGDQDLMEVVGGSGPNLLFVNSGAAFQEKATMLGLDYPLASGRTVLWYDWDLDGRLDALLLNEINVVASALFRNNVTGFENVTSSAGLQVQRSRYAHLYPLAGDGNTQLIFGPPGAYPQAIYNAYTIPYQELSGIAGLSESGAVNDVAIADFNGDALPDIFLVNAKGPSDAVLSSPTRLEVFLGNNLGESIVFKTSGDVLFDLQSRVDVADIYIGSAGWQPTASSFQLAAQDQSVWGILDEVPVSGTGFYIGYEPVAGQWTLKAFRNGFQVSALILTTEPIESFVTIGFDPFVPVLGGRYLQNSAQGFVDRTQQAIGPQLTNCPSVAAGDFDNDMDVDIYMACSGVVDGLPNVMYENQGDGTFQSVPGTGGAQGDVDGQSDVVVVADIDMDGFLDLFVANGHGSMHTAFYDGQDQLFRNLGNNNNWIEIDLEGSLSNRDGIGTRVTLTAGGVTQQRFQGGGMHAFGQDFKRIHFGLAQNTTVEQLTVEWPNGTSQIVTDIEANQIIHILEGSSAVNRRPMISGMPVTSIAEDSSYSMIPTASDKNGDTLLFSINNKPAWATFNAMTGELSGVPTNSDVGTTSGIVIKVDDQVGRLNSTASLPPFDLTVTNVNDAPVASDDAASVRKGETVNINVAGNDLDVDDGLDLSTINIVSKPENGMVVVNANGTVDYVENMAGVAADSFTYTISDAGGVTSNIAAVNITIILPDSNSDGISDVAAIALGLDPNDPDGDTDGDGIPDITEVGGSINAPLDSDSDGVIDALEPGADATDASVVGAFPLTGGGSVRISTAVGEALSQVSADAVTGAPTGISFPFGVISYTTTSEVGGNVTVRMTLSTNLPPNLVIYKVNAAGVYTRLPTDSWKQVDSRTVDVTLKDGDPLTDLDGLVNGLIDDPIALGEGAAPVVSGADSGGGGGCVINNGSGNDPLFPFFIFMSVIYLSRRRLGNI
ncbi:MAG TPA: hypothetical protein ENJ35_09925 [Gammaproteobacteria bacterium]|nr:hypothetical protein [Gammaproteobacteria bacterium]